MCLTLIYDFTGLRLIFALFTLVITNIVVFRDKQHSFILLVLRFKHLVDHTSTE